MVLYSIHLWCIYLSNLPWYSAYSFISVKKKSMFAKLLHNHQVQEDPSQHQATLPPCPDTPWRRATETWIDWTFFLMTRTKFGICWLCRSTQLHCDSKFHMTLSLYLTVAGRSPRRHANFLRTKECPVLPSANRSWLSDYPSLDYLREFKKGMQYHAISSEFVFWILVSACSWHRLSHIMEPTGCSTYLLQQPLWKSCTRSS